MTFYSRAHHLHFCANSLVPRVPAMVILTRMIADDANRRSWPCKFKLNAFYIVN
jgi:hypothetical protein